jgi:hypothetical protein
MVQVVLAAGSGDENPLAAGMSFAVQQLGLQNVLKAGKVAVEPAASDLIWQHMASKSAWQASQHGKQVSTVIQLALRVHGSTQMLRWTLAVEKSRSKSTCSSRCQCGVGELLVSWWAVICLRWGWSDMCVWGGRRGAEEHSWADMARLIKLLRRARGWWHLVCVVLRGNSIVYVAAD